MTAFSPSAAARSSSVRNSAFCLAVSPREATLGQSMLETVAIQTPRISSAGSDGEPVAPRAGVGAPGAVLARGAHAARTDTTTASDFSKRSTVCCRM